MHIRRNHRLACRTFDCTFRPRTLGFVGVIVDLLRVTVSLAQRPGIISLVIVPDPFGALFLPVPILRFDRRLRIVSRTIRALPRAFRGGDASILPRIVLRLPGQQRAETVTRLHPEQRRRPAREMVLARPQPCLPQPRRLS